MKIRGLVFDAERSIDVEPDELYDRSRYGNDGTSTAITWARLPSGLWVMSFNGTSSLIDLGANNSLAMEDKDFSLVGWFYPTSITDRCIFGGDNGGVGLYLYDPDTSVPNKKMQLTELGITGAPLSTSVVTPDVWSFLVITFDSHSATNNLKYNINGALDSTVTYDKNFAASTKTRRLGCQYMTGARFFEGKMGLPRMLNYVLSATQIRKIFDAEAPLFGV